MFRWSLLILLLLPTWQAIPQQMDSCNLSWTPPRQLSFDTLNVSWPQIHRNGDTVFVLWIRGDFRGLGAAYSRSTDGGATWSVPQMLIEPTTDNNTSAVYSASSGNWIYISWNGCNPCSPFQYPEIRFLRSSDFGNTWFPRQTLGRRFAGPVAAFDNNVFVNINDSLDRCRVLISNDYGSTFATRSPIPQILVARLFSGFAATPTGLHGLTAQPLQVNGKAVVVYYRSSDYGQTWDTPRVLSTIDNYNKRVNDFSAVNDNVYAVWTDGKYGGFPFTGSVLARRSSDGGVTFEPEQILSSNNTFRYSVDSRVSIVSISWDSDEDGSGVYSHVYYTVSRNSGLSFCTPARIEQTFFATEAPDIAAGQNLFLAASWRDSGVFPQSKIFFTRSENLTGVRDEQNTVPDEFSLADPFPNPFNPTVTIQYSIREPAAVTIDFYNVLGQKVRSLERQQVMPGTHRKEWNGKDDAGRVLPSGVYVVRVNAGNRFQHKKVVYLK